MRPPVPLLFTLIVTFQAASAFAAEPTSVAVMPFRDLTGAKSAVGDAIRESVTTDLRGVSGIRVVERGEIDRVLAEQKLQGAEIDRDPLATLRIGKLIGADLICVGAYQQVARRVRLTARFVRTQTGEVVGTAKVDGDVGQFLALQDQVTVELLRSAKLAPTTVARMARRAPRPKLRNIRAVELYGRSLTEKSEPMKRALLREAVLAEPQYVYAKDALTEIEERLRAYEARMAKAQQAAAVEAEAAFTAAATPGERFMAAHAFARVLAESRRFFALQAMWSRLAEELEGSDDAEAKRQAPHAWQQALLALHRLGKQDAFFEGAQRMLSRYPDAPEFGAVKVAMERVIEDRREQEAQKGEPAQLFKLMNDERQWDLCQVARLYAQAKQREQARRLYLACYETGSGDPVTAVGQLVQLSLDVGDQAAARRYLERLEQISPVAHESARSMAEHRLAADG